MYEKRTLRKMKPVQRRLAIQCNEIERVQRRLRRLVEEVGRGRAGGAPVGGRRQ